MPYLCPNPSTTAFLRAGELADRATFYRHDLVFNDPTAGELPPNPHAFLLDLINLDCPNPLVRFIALAAQEQIAEFFASECAVVIDPDDTEPLVEVPVSLFETPINLPLPEECGFVVKIPDFKVCQ